MIMSFHDAVSYASQSRKEQAENTIREYTAKVLAESTGFTTPDEFRVHLRAQFRPVPKPRSVINNDPPAPAPRPRPANLCLPPVPKPRKRVWHSIDDTATPISKQEYEEVSACIDNSGAPKLKRSSVPWYKHTTEDPTPLTDDDVPCVCVVPGAPANGVRYVPKNHVVFPERDWWTGA